MPPLPFAPLQSSDPITPPVEQYGGLPIAAPSLTGYTPEQIETHKLYRSQPKEPEGYGILPHVVATMAAANGNFGPVFTILEQKRKTGVYKQFNEVLPQISKLRASGKLDEAIEMANAFVGTIGDRSPELATFMQTVTSGIASEQQEWNDLQVVSTVVNKRLQNAPKDDPRRIDAEILDELVKSRSKVSKELRTNLLEGMKLTQNVSDNKVVQTTPSSITPRVSALPVIPDTSKLDSYAMKRLSGALELSPEQIQKIRVGQDVFKTLPNGSVVNYNTDKYREFLESTAIPQMLEESAAFDEAKNVPVSADLGVSLVDEQGRRRAALRRYGRAEANINGAQLPTGESGDVQRIIDADQKRREKIATAPYEARLDVPAVTLDNPIYIIDKKTGQHKEFMTLREAQAAQKEYKGFGQKVYEEKVRPLYIALEGLKHVDEMFKELGDSTAILERLSTGTNRLVQRYTGITDQKTALSTVARVAVERAVEVLEDTKAVDDATIGDLKKAIAGGFTDSKVGREVARKAMIRLIRKIENNVGSGEGPDLDTPLSPIGGEQSVIPQSQQNRAQQLEGDAVYQNRVGQPPPQYPTEQQKQGATEGTGIGQRFIRRPKK